MDNKKLKKDDFFAKIEAAGLALTYDDVRLKSGYSEIDPANVSIKTRFSKNITLNCPVVSAAMDTVTEEEMAIAMAKLGGLGIIHKALTPEVQASQVRRVKLHLNGLIDKPIFVNENDTIGAIEKLRDEKNYRFHTFPVIGADGKLAGILTRTDFLNCCNNESLSKDVMTPIGKILTAPAGTTLEDAHKIMNESKKGVLPLINELGELAGVYTFADVSRLLKGTATLYNTDKDGHLRVGAAIGTGDDALTRAALLVDANCDVLVIDTAHGDSKNVYVTLKAIKEKYPKIDVVVGNISEGESAKRLVDAGADGIKVGQGPGSICTTRIVAGIGCPQVSAVYNCAKALRGTGVPVCADGGITTSGDIPIALGAGADCVMLGRMLAGTEETPGEVRDTEQGRIKMYRGMGSLGAMQSSRASRERYRQGDAAIDKLVPEGVEGFVTYQGKVSDILHKYIGGLRSGMGYVGAGSVEALQEKADFHRITHSGLRESHPHDILQ